MGEPIIRAENLGKKYLIRHQKGDRYTSLRDVLSYKARSLFGRNGSRESGSRHQPAMQDFWALKNVNFEVNEGEVIGIIGRNGAGKSTLLKVLSRITEPTEGRVTLRGRVASLLEVGTGFHPELTGRENIYLNGAILGMTRAEIRKKFDEIVAFAEIDRFLDTPVKRYSSGMYVRLAFAVAAYLEPEILLVDEVLAVGDAEFQKKCLGKMERVATREGRTVLFVSHNMGAITQLCEAALLLESGRIAACGEPREMLRLYTGAGESPERDLERQVHTFRGPLNDNITFTAVAITSGNGTNATLISPSSPITIQVKGRCQSRVPAFRVTLGVFSAGVRIFSMHDVEHAEELPDNSRFKSLFLIQPYFLRPGDYFIAVGGHSASTGEWLWGMDIAQFRVLEEWTNDFRSYDTGLINVPREAQRVIMRGES